MKIIDLSQTFEKNMTQFPGTPSLQLRVLTSIEESGFQVTDLHAVVHVGTHCDAPKHFIPSGKTIDVLPLEKFVGEAVIVDAKNVQGPELPLSILENISIQKGDIVLLRTNASQLWNTEKYVEQSFYLSQALADRLVELEINALGIDFLSPDEVTSETSPIHHTLLKNEIVLIENLKNLDQIQKERFFFSAAPLKIKNSDGTFTRAYAIV